MITLCNKYYFTTFFYLLGLFCYSQNQLSFPIYLKYGITQTEVYNIKEKLFYNPPLSGNGFLLSAGAGIRYDFLRFCAVSVKPSFNFMTNSVRLKRIDVPDADRYSEWFNNLDIPILFDFHFKRKYCSLGYGMSFYRPYSGNVYGGVENQQIKVTEYAQNKFVNNLYAGAGFYTEFKNRGEICFGLIYRKGFGSYIKGFVEHYEYKHLIAAYNFRGTGDYIALDISYRFIVNSMKKKQ